MFEQVHHHCCLVDASWISHNHNIDIGWSLYNCKPLLCGSGSFPPTQSLAHAEVEALRMAVVELHRLGYRDVIFCGDLQKLYGLLQNSSMNLKNPQVMHLLYIVQLQDITNIAKLCNFTFLHISREANGQVDQMTKQVRIHSHSYIVKWSI